MTDSISAILLLNAVACLVGLFLCFAVMRRQRRLLLFPLTLTVFLLTNGLSQGAHLWLLSDIAFGTDPVMFHRALQVNVIVVMCAVIPLVVLSQLRGVRSTQPLQISPRPILILVGLSGLMIGYFIFRNREIVPLSGSLYLTGDYAEYSAIRNEIGVIVASHALSGSAPANWAAGVFCPASLVLLPHCRGLSRFSVRMLFLLASLMMVGTFFVMGGRFGLIFGIAFPFVALALAKMDRSGVARLAKLLWKPVAATLLVAVVLFRFLLGTSAFDAAKELLARSALIPGAVSASYYMAFPETFDFRGWSGVLMMPIPGDKVTFTDISASMFNLNSSANAGFTAIAYSGAGLPGVLAASLFMTLVLMLADLALLRVPSSLGDKLVLGNLYGVLVLGSVPALVAITTHGLALGPLCIVLLLWMTRRLSTRVTKARPTSVGTVAS